METLFSLFSLGAAVCLGAVAVLLTIKLQNARLTESSLKASLEAAQASLNMAIEKGELARSEVIASRNEHQGQREINLVLEKTLELEKVQFEDKIPSKTKSEPLRSVSRRLTAMSPESGTRWVSKLASYTSLMTSSVSRRQIWFRRSRATTSRRAIGAK